MRRKGTEKSQKKSKASERKRDDEHFDEFMSTTSHETLESVKSIQSARELNKRVASSVKSQRYEEDEVEEEYALDHLSSALDKLAEKRSSIRIDGLKSLLVLLQQTSDYESIYRKRNDLLESLSNSVRRVNMDSEVLIALKSISSLCVCLGPNQDDLFRQISRLMISIITRNSNIETRIEACRTLAMSCFVCCSEEDTTEDTLTFLYHVSNRTSEGLQVPIKLAGVALRGWTFLASAGPRDWLGGTAPDIILPTIKDLLLTGAENIDVREAAGEAAALIREAVDELRDVQVEFQEQHEIGTNLSEEYGELDNLWDEISGLMLEYSKESSKRINKEDKKVQRRAFKELFAAVTEGEPPQWQELFLQTCSLQVNTWAEMIRLDGLRACLQGGFQMQAQNNPFVRDVLRINGNSKVSSMLDKGSVMRKNQSRIRTQDRASRQSEKDSFFWNDE